MVSRCQAASWVVVISLIGYFAAHATYNIISCNVPTGPIHKLQRTNPSIFIIEYIVDNKLQICVIEAENITHRTKFFYRLASPSECCTTKQGSITMGVAFYIVALILCVFIMIAFCSRCCLFSPNPNQTHNNAQMHRIIPLQSMGQSNTSNTHDIRMTETPSFTVKDASALSIGVCTTRQSSSTDRVIVVINPD